jgi:hypothetical protein
MSTRRIDIQDGLANTECGAAASCCKLLAILKRDGVSRRRRKLSQPPRSATEGRVSSVIPLDLTHSEKSVRLNSPDDQAVISNSASEAFSKASVSETYIVEGILETLLS